MKPTRGGRAFEPVAGIHAARPPRAERVSKQLREEISQLMVREMKDPRVRLASVSEVRLSRDMKSARVMVSALGEDRERHEVVAALRHASGYLRAQLGGRLENLKVVPTLTFELDESIAYSVHISATLRDMHLSSDTTEEPGAAGPSGDEAGGDQG